MPLRKLEDIEEEQRNSAVLFTFYYINDDLEGDDRYWEYGKLPQDWWWVGSGGTENPLYPLEAQFMGPPETKLKMKAILEEKLKKLKASRVLIRYKIRSSYKP